VAGGGGGVFPNVNFKLLKELQGLPKTLEIRDNTSGKKGSKSRAVLESFFLSPCM